MKITTLNMAAGLALGLLVPLLPAQIESERPAAILHEYSLAPFSLEHFGYTPEQLAAAQANGLLTTQHPAIGSGLQQLHGNHYISITDRGPTFDRNSPAGSKAFPLPQFNPTI